VLANNLSLSIHNPILIYSFFAVYGLLMLSLLLYVHSKFRSASKTLTELRTEWQSAASQHSSFVGLAQERLAALSRPTPLIARTSGLGADIRNHIVAMAKRGTAVHDIARTCGLYEGEIDVILGMARLQR
jgi:hypothetical protein